MKRDQVEKLIKNCPFPGDCTGAQLIETHISWIILTDQYSYKIKRPVSFSFLDFSTLDRRKYYCEREVELNRRTAEDMYLGVLPVTQEMVNNNGGDAVVDYAVKMKRMDNALEMDKLLREKRVRDVDITKLAEVVARFHSRVPIVKDVFDTNDFQKKYNDIRSVKTYVLDTFDDQVWSAINQCIERSDMFLNTRRDYFNERVISGFRRDCHGDLNASNIFLYEDPVIFDCVEFNDSYRQIDVLNDIAFLCVDLDYHKSRLGDLFYQSYVESSGVPDDDDTRQLLLYYKGYRANVRAKVTAIEAREDERSEDKNEMLRRYISLMQLYARSL